MSVIPITVYGDKILREKTKPVTDIDSNLIKTIKNMFLTMHNANGVGLAANQVGIDKSIFVIDLSDVEGYEKLKPVVMINPRIVLFSDETVPIEEGCLSLPQLRAEVIRPSMIKVNFFDTDMKEHSVEADGFFARVIQHEYDHLQGKFFTDRLTDELKKQVKKDLIEIKNRKVEVDYPITDKVLA
ncbi:MAG: peptide deformylase [Syntrophothermus sp.]